MLAAVKRFFVGPGFAAYASTLLVLFASVLGTVVLWPPAPDGFGAFAAEFRVWCLGEGASDSGASRFMLFATFFEILSMAALIAFVWWGPLRVAASSPAGRRQLRGPLLGAVFSAGMLAAALWFLGKPEEGAGVAFPAQALRTAVPAPRVELTGHDGQLVSLDALRGDVVVLTAVYASCGTACPRILGQARRVVEGLPEPLRSSVRVLGVTLDPEHDTPETMAALAQSQRISAPTFRLLSGPLDRVNDVLDAMGVQRKRNAKTGVIDHANVFVLVDRSGRVAYRFALDAKHERWMGEALQVLAREPRLPTASRAP